MKKILALGIILLFIGVAVAPSINFTVVKASDDNDLVEVTTQACGIQGYGNTTVKLTREQYQNLEQYLVDFRARLNQTTTRAEAVPIFKEAVVELDKYGLLPKGMSVERAKKFVTAGYRNNELMKILQRLLDKNQYIINSNLFCLVVGHTNETDFQSVLRWIVDAIFYYYYHQSDFHPIMVGIFVLLQVLYIEVAMINPIPINNVIGLGWYGTGFIQGKYPANGWLFTIGLLGIKKWNDTFYGALPTITDFPNWLYGAYPGVIGFTGFQLYLNFTESFYIGFAPLVKINSGYPS